MRSALLSVAVALGASGLVVLAAGVDPAAALRVLALGALGSGEAVAYTLYYATSFLFAGLAVALAFQAGLFNIGGEGQAMLGGLGATLAALALDGWPAPCGSLDESLPRPRGWPDTMSRRDAGLFVRTARRFALPHRLADMTQEVGESFERKYPLEARQALLVGLKNACLEAARRGGADANLDWFGATVKAADVGGHLVRMVSLHEELMKLGGEEVGKERSFKREGEKVRERERNETKRKKLTLSHKKPKQKQTKYRAAASSPSSASTSSATRSTAPCPNGPPAPAGPPATTRCS